MDKLVAREWHALWPRMGLPKFACDRGRSGDTLAPSSAPREKGEIRRGRKRGTGRTDPDMIGPVGISAQTLQP
jgi:hypothetical protein